MNWLNNPYMNNFGWGSNQNGGGGNPYDVSAQSSPQQLASAYNNWSGMNGGNTAANQATANNWLTGQGVSPGQVNQGYGMYQAGVNNMRTNPVLWNQLNSGSSLQDVASAYSRWSAQNGGDTAANQATAQNYLTGMGFDPNQINQAYGMYQGIGMNNAPIYSQTQQATMNGTRDLNAPATNQIHGRANRNMMANNVPVPGAPASRNIGAPPPMQGGLANAAQFNSQQPRPGMGLYGGEMQRLPQQQADVTTLYNRQARGDGLGLLGRGRVDEILSRGPQDGRWKNPFRRG